MAMVHQKKQSKTIRGILVRVSGEDILIGVKNLDNISTRKSKVEEPTECQKTYKTLREQDAFEFTQTDFTSPDWNIVSAGRQQFYFKDTDKLGAGCYGEVFKGWDVVQKIQVAIKLCHRTHDARKEWNMYEKLNSYEGFPNCYYSGVAERVVKKKLVTCGIIVLDLLGESLSSWCERWKSELHEEAISKTGPISTLNIMLQLVDRFKILGQLDIVHGDIKPQNFVFGRGPNAHKIYVLDFGLAKFMNDTENRDRYVRGFERVMKPRKPCGTPQFASYNMHGHKINGKHRLQFATFVDDLQSIAFVGFWMTHKLKLPWMNFSSLSKDYATKYKMMQDFKGLFFEKDTSRVFRSYCKENIRERELLERAKLKHVTWFPCICDGFQPFLARSQELYENKLKRTVKKYNDQLTLGSEYYLELMILLENGLNHTNVNGPSPLLVHIFPEQYSPENLKTQEDPIALIQPSHPKHLQVSNSNNSNSNSSSSSSSSASCDGGGAKPIAQEIKNRNTEQEESKTEMEDTTLSAATDSGRDTNTNSIKNLSESKYRKAKKENTAIVKLKRKRKEKEEWGKEIENQPKRKKKKINF